MSTREFIGGNFELLARGKKKFYSIRFRRNGVLTYRALKTPNKAVARQRAATLIQKLPADGDAPAPVSLTIGEAISRYLDHKRKHDRVGRTTNAKYTGVLECFGAWCDQQRIHALDQLSVQRFRQYENHHAKDHEAKTTFCAMTIIKSFGTWLGPAGQALLDVAPFAAARLKEPRPNRKYVPTPASINAIIEAATNEAKVQLMTLAMTGMRVAELVHLRPMDVDVEHGWIHVRARPGWTPKTHEDRKIPIHPKLLEHLCTLNRACRPYFFRGLAEGTRKPAPQVSDSRLLRHMQAIAERLKIPTKRENAGIVIHSFRDHFETVTVNSGIPQFVVDSWMGHSGGRTQGQRYYGLSDEKSQEFMKKVEF